MTIQRSIFAIAGFFVMISLALGVEESPVFINKYFLFFTAFVGLNLFQYAFTGFCPMEYILKSFGLKSCCDK